MASTTGKAAEGTGKASEGRTGKSDSREKLEIAHQVHTLAELVYAQLASRHPWLAPMTGSPGLAVGPGATWPPVWSQQART